MSKRRSTSRARALFPVAVLALVVELLSTWNAAVYSSALMYARLPTNVSWAQQQCSPRSAERAVYTFYRRQGITVEVLSVKAHRHGGYIVRVRSERHVWDVRVDDACEVIRNPQQ